MWIVQLFIFCALVAICTAQNVSESNQLFSAKLYQALHTKRRNVFYSPLSIHVLLATLYQWSTESTEDALKNSLNLPDKMSTLKEYRVILPFLLDGLNSTLKSVSKIYLAGGSHMREPPMAQPGGALGTELEFIDFSDAKSAVNAINRWAGRKTEQSITKLVTADDFDNSTHGLLLNAVYLRGIWSHRFFRKRTKVLPFHVNSSKPPVKCHMMQKRSFFHYGELHRNGIYEAQILKLRFKDKRYSMFIILPTPWRTIEQIEEILTELKLEKIEASLKFTYMKVILPRFKIQTKYNLVSPLTKIGLGMIFGDDASYLNFMDTYDSLSITNIFQKATIVIDEKGGESTSVSDTPLVHRGKPSTDPILFLANHPFLFIITAGVGPENQKKYDDEVIVFMGKVTAPRAVKLH